MNTLKQKVTRKDINKSGFKIVMLIGKRKLTFKSVGIGFEIFEKGKFIHHVNNLYGDV